MFWAGVLFLCCPLRALSLSPVCQCLSRVICLDASSCMMLVLDKLPSHRYSSFHPMIFTALHTYFMTFGSQYDTLHHFACMSSTYHTLHDNSALNDVSALHDVALHDTALHDRALHDVALHHIALHDSVLYDSA